jgi:thiamine-monophosphate kinase
MTTPLGPGAEFDAIRALVSRWGDRSIGIGDDAAVLSVPRGNRLVVSVDTAIENQHFRAYLTPREIGYRAVTAALSDLAAMAAEPIAILVAIALPPAWRDELGELGDGIGEAAAVARTRIAGGNLSDASEASITTTVLGSAFAPLMRSGARAGDRVYVTGSFGAPAEALRRLDGGEAAGVYRERFVRPTARIAEARWLADRGVSSAIDVSDGLIADARHVAHASGVTIELDASRVPCVDGIAPERAIASGEEYELLVTKPCALDVQAFENRFATALTEIGRVSAGAAAVHLIGARFANAHGHDHFFR